MAFDCRSGELALGDGVVDRGDAAAQLDQRILDVDLLALELVQLLLELLARVQRLRHAAVVVRVVEIEDLADLGEAEADAAAAQDQDDAGAIAAGVDASLAAPLGRNQAFIFVEAQRARGDVKFLGELTDRESATLVRYSGSLGVDALSPGLPDNFSV